MEQTVKPQSQPERGKHLMDEPDIGSGEKSPGERETEEQIRQIPPLPEHGRREAPGAKPS
ncbi:hypothetical protein GTP41_08560 [Pseudoduganella sp. DS3]|uniref:Uncharacterized protein n=1 Tax=Pseudoduganella guangdongensis TaxID=2692179 RepID=A0A6N9HF40_9BURK|nr:hypothetical protein [Pseudoduganella guangdongensis]MYN02154.1 hypothetical protein [Pseudoduganella guangdongensis]